MNAPEWLKNSLLVGALIFGALGTFERGCSAPPAKPQPVATVQAEPAKPLVIKCEMNLKQIQLPWVDRLTYGIAAQGEDCKSPWFVRPLNARTNLRSARFSWSADVDVCVEYGYADKAPDEKCTVISPFQDGIIPNTVTAVRFSKVKQDAVVNFIFVW